MLKTKAGVGEPQSNAKDPLPPHEFRINFLVTEIDKCKENIQDAVQTQERYERERPDWRSYEPKAREKQDKKIEGQRRREQTERKKLDAFRLEYKRLLLGDQYIMFETGPGVQEPRSNAKTPRHADEFRIKTLVLEIDKCKEKIQDAVERQERYERERPDWRSYEPKAREKQFKKIGIQRQIEQTESKKLEAYTFEYQRLLLEVLHRRRPSNVQPSAACPISLTDDVNMGWSRQGSEVCTFDLLNHGYFKIWSATTPVFATCPPCCFAPH